MTTRTEPAKIYVVPFVVLANLKVRILANVIEERPMAVKLRVSTSGAIVNKNGLVVL